MASRYLFATDSRRYGFSDAFGVDQQMSTINSSPMFNCCLEHNRTTACSIIKMFDILDDETGRKGEGEGLSERAKAFLRDHLFEAFNYLPASDLKKLILGSDAYLEDVYKVGKDKTEKSISLFRFVTIPIVANPASVIPVQTLGLLFKFAKKNLNTLRSYLGNISSESGLKLSDIHDCIPSSDTYYFELRRAITDFLAFLKRYLYLICGNSASSVANPSNSGLHLFQLCACILKELKCLLIFTGRIHQFRRYFWIKTKNYSLESPFSHISEQKGALYNYYHAVLEIWWATVEMTYLIQEGGLTTRYSFNDIYLVKEDPASAASCKLVGHPMFTQSIRMLTYDLLLLGSRAHFDVSFTPCPDYHYTSPFICTCTWEMIVSLRLIITNCALRSTNDFMDSQEEAPQICIEPFYEFIFSILSLFEGSPKELPKRTKSRSYSNSSNLNSQEGEIYFEHFHSIVNPKVGIATPLNYRLFQIWIFTNLSPLFALEVTYANGLKIADYKVPLPALLTKMYRQALKETEASGPIQTGTNHEVILYNFLILTIKCSHFLSSINCDVLSLFVEHFLKKLNVNYSLHHHQPGTGGKSGIQEYSWMPRNSNRWVKIVEQMTAGGCSGAFEMGASNFKLFLTLLTSQLHRLFGSRNGDLRVKSQNVQFQKLISKIVVTLQPRTLKTLTPVGVYNLGTFYLSIIASIPGDRWSELSDKTLTIFNEIAKSVCAEARPNGSTLELVMQFHFALLHQQEKCSEDVTGKLIAQLAKLFVTFQLELFKANLRTYASFVRLYFEELELLLGLVKTAQAGTKVRITVLGPLLLNLDLLQITRNVRSARSSIESRHPRLLETLSEILQFTLKQLQTRKRPETSLLDDFDEQISSLIDSQDFPVDSKNDHQNEIVEFAKKLNESLRDLIKNELMPSFEETDEELVSSIVFNVTLLSLLLENQSHLNTQPLLSTVKFFLSLPGKSQSSFQINYLFLLLEDVSILSKLKEEELTEEILYSEMAVLFISTWTRLLPFGVTTCPVKMSSISRNLFCNLLPIIDSSSVPSKTPEEETLAYYRLLLKRHQSRYSRLGSLAEKSSHISLVSRQFSPLVGEVKSLFQSVKNGSVTSVLKTQVRTGFWLVANLVNLASAQMYQMGRADSLLAVICEHLLIISSGPLSDASDTTLVKCFPLIFEGICQLNLNSDPYLERKLRLLILFYLPLMSKANSFEQIKNILTQKTIYESWKAAIRSALEKVYLSQKNQVSSRHLFEYLERFCATELTDNAEQLLKLARAFKSINLGDYSLTDYRGLLWQTLSCKAVEKFETDENYVKQYVDGILIPFVESNLSNRPVKCFEVLKSLLPRKASVTSPALFHVLLGQLYRLLDQVERTSVSGTNQVIRKLLRDFISIYEQRPQQQPGAIK